MSEETPRLLGYDTASGPDMTVISLNGRPITEEQRAELLRLLTSLDAAPAPSCECDLRTRLVGDGCEVCNPELAAEMAAPLPGEVEFLQIVLDGKASGRMSEWPQLRPACKAALDLLIDQAAALSDLQAQLGEALAAAHCAHADLKEQGKQLRAEEAAVRDLRAQLAERTSSVIIHNGQAPACSTQVQEAWATKERECEALEWMVEVQEAVLYHALKWGKVVRVCISDSQSHPGNETTFSPQGSKRRRWWQDANYEVWKTLDAALAATEMK